MEEGGETVFPQAETKVTGPEWSECAKQGLGVKTKKGDALLFFRSVRYIERSPACSHMSQALLPKFGFLMLERSEVLPYCYQADVPAQASASHLYWQGKH